MRIITEDCWFCYRLRGDGRASVACSLQTTPPAASPQRALLDKYCVTCHNDRAKTGGLTLEKIDVANIPANAETWEKVIRKLSVGAMPPVRHAETKREPTSVHFYLL